MAPKLFQSNSVLGKGVAIGVIVLALLIPPSMLRDLLAVAMLATRRVQCVSSQWYRD